MRKPENFDKTEAITGGEFKQLPPGAYVCTIKEAFEVTTQGGKNMLQLWLDIAEGEHRDHFQNQYAAAGRKFGDAKWRGTYNQLTEGESLGYFKGLLLDIENSNPGYKFNFDEKTLVKKKIGGVFGREQYRNQKGELKFAVKCLYCTEAGRVKDIAPPADRLLEAGKANGGGNGGYGEEPPPVWEEPGADDSLPF